MAQPLLLVVGLRNFGYSGTRHNVGEAALLRLAKRKQITFARSRDGMEIAEYAPRVLLALPKTFMNLSGKAVKAALPKPIQAGNLLVCHDELDLKLKQVKIKRGGSARGHNGIKSIISSLGGIDSFNRVCIGIDRPANALQIPDYVLKQFTKQEEEALDEALERAGEVIEEQIKLWLAANSTAA